MGNDALHCWGDKAAINSSEQLKEQQTKLQRHGKKVCWHSTFGEIAVIDPIFHRLGQQLRPLLSTSGNLWADGSLWSDAVQNLEPLLDVQEQSIGLNDD